MLKDVIKNTGVMYLGGVIALLGGIVIVMFHNEWVKSWEVLITIIGWLALIKGVLLLVLPDAMMDWTKAFTKKKGYLMFGAIIAVIMGLYLGYYGYFV